jgi:hypothetical protein
MRKAGIKNAKFHWLTSVFRRNFGELRKQIRDRILLLENFLLRLVLPWLGR